MRGQQARHWFLGPPENGIPLRNAYSQAMLLEHLGIKEVGLTTYVRIFASEKKTCPVIREAQQHCEPDGRTCWRTCRHSWCTKDILRHLAGQRALGLYWSTWADHLVIDFDTHGNQSQRKACDTARAVVASLPGEWLLYQSSFSGGIRALVNVFDEPNMKWLKERFRRRWQMKESDPEPRPFLRSSGSDGCGLRGG